MRLVKTLRHCKHPLLLLMALGRRDWTAPHGPSQCPTSLLVQKPPSVSFIPYTVQLYLHCSPKSFKQGKKPPVFTRNCSLVNVLMENVQLWLPAHQAPGGVQLTLLLAARPTLTSSARHGDFSLAFWAKPLCCIGYLATGIRLIWTYVTVLC